MIVSRFKETTQQFTSFNFENYFVKWLIGMQHALSVALDLITSNLNMENLNQN